MVLDHLHVHERRADAVGHRDPVAGADERVRGRAPDLAVAAGREDHVLGLEELHRAGLDVPRDGADALAVAVDRERGREVLLVAVDRVRVLHQLLVEDVHDRLAGDVGDVVGARRRGAAEGAGAEVALVVAVEGDAEVLEVDDLLGRLAAHDLDRVLVAQVVGALDRVERVRLPRVVGVERGVDPALRGVRVRAHGVDLRDDPDRHAGLGSRERGALPGQPCSYDKYVVTRHPRRVTLFGRNPTFARGIARSRRRCSIEAAVATPRLRSAGLDYALTPATPAEGIRQNRLMDVGELPDGWVSWEIEPIEPGARRTADEVMASRPNGFSRLLTQRVLQQKAGSWARRRGLTTSIRGGFGLLNRQDYRFLDSSYTPDCVVEYSGLSGLALPPVATGFKEVRDVLEEMRSPFESVVHLPAIAIDAGGPTSAAAVRTVYTGARSGLELSDTFWYCWELKGSRIKRQLVTTDRDAMFERLKKAVA